MTAVRFKMEIVEEGAVGGSDVCFISRRRGSRCVFISREGPGGGWRVASA